MTPTEAIRHLGALSAFANADEVKAVEMAIEALGVQPPIMKLDVPSNTITFYDPANPSEPPIFVRNGRQVEVNPGWSPTTTNDAPTATDCPETEAEARRKMAATSNRISRDGWARCPYSEPHIHGVTPTEPHITRNAIECRECGEVIESKHEYDYRMCKCPGATGCSVDGGLLRLSRTGSNYIERSEWG